MRKVWIILAVVVAAGTGIYARNSMHRAGASASENSPASNSPSSAYAPSTSPPSTKTALTHFAPPSRPLPSIPADPEQIPPNALRQADTQQNERSKWSILRLHRDLNEIENTAAAMHLDPAIAEKLKTWAMNYNRRFGELDQPPRGKEDIKKNGRSIGLLREAHIRAERRLLGNQYQKYMEIRDAYRSGNIERALHPTDAGSVETGVVSEARIQTGPLDTSAFDPLFQ